MDQLTAYRILGLEENASREEVKSAYAALSKQYHPEEHPEEFQRLHEAYKTLSRSARWIPQEGHTAEQPKSIEYHTKEPESSTDTWDFQNIYTKPEPSKEPNVEAVEQAWNFRSIQTDAEPVVEEDSYDFDKILEDANSKEQARIHEEVLKALAEMNILLSPAYCEKTKLFKAFFQKKEYENVLKTPEFIQRFAELLEHSSLKKSIYNYIIDFYRMRGLNPQELLPSAAALYHVLDKKCGMKRSNRYILYVGLPAGVVAGLRSSLISVGHQNTMIGVSILFLAVFLLMVWGYRKLHENHSSIFAQTILAVSLLVLQFLAIFTGLYQAVFPNEDGEFLVAGLLILGSIIWLIILGIIAIMKKIIRKTKSK